MSEVSERIAVMGGSFDPVHRGHLIMAQDVLNQFQLNKVYFVPATHAPLREMQPKASNEARMEMLTLAVAEYPQFEILDIELKSKEISYTYNTVRKLIQKWPEAKIYWIIGKDQLLKIHNWFNIKELSKIAEFICVDRPNYDSANEEGISTIRLHWVKEHLIDISSTKIRDTIKKGGAIEAFVPKVVAEYIKKNKLYQ